LCLSEILRNYIKLLNTQFSFFIEATIIMFRTSIMAIECTQMRITVDIQLTALVQGKGALNGSLSLIHSISKDFLI
jgi:hypothetical protein